jgi:hypothetical protein
MSFFSLVSRQSSFSLPQPSLSLSLSLSLSHPASLSISLFLSFLPPSIILHAQINGTPVVGADQAALASLLAKHAASLRLRLSLKAN